MKGISKRRRKHKKEKDSKRRLGPIPEARPARSKEKNKENLIEDEDE
jgi:hypothetical protein